jgi:predicted thioesterase
MTLDGLKLGLRYSATLTVSESLSVPAQARIFDPGTDMPPVFATAQMIAFVEWTCVAALAPYLGSDQRTVGTRVDMTHTAATPIGMTVTAEVELVEVNDRTLALQGRLPRRERPDRRGFSRAHSHRPRPLHGPAGAEASVDCVHSLRVI